ncbi:AEC family transporter [Isachenkonia alkalipeptolytica]|uniref:AEC family transporter n=1 Tax=Isachenkonia alkalipeptolytica TaxID=2565777 RepID=A0AA44BDV5_9CLOT|nr:AEC family transporter [Isachenkonia alkalipeptolytica]NBG88318.1 AEC family transporter [Isachenkonia alkalipeptolytica]
MDFFTTFYQILSLFILIAVGWGASRLKLLDQHFVKTLSVFVIKVTLPAMIIKSMQFDFSVEVLWDSAYMFLVGIGMYALMIALSYGIVKFSGFTGARANALQFLIIFGNVGYMGYPVMASIFGDEGVFYTALFNIPFNFLMMSLGVYLMTRKNSGDSEDGKGPLDASPGEEKSFKGKLRRLKVLINPGIVATFTGFTLFLLSIEIPGPLFRSMDILGEATTPLAMIIIGANLSRVALGSVFREKALYGLVFLRLILIPAFLFGLLTLLGVEGFLLKVPVLIFSMPAAANAVVFAVMYEGDADFAAKGVFFTTLCSGVTLPIIAYMLLG